MPPLVVNQDPTGTSSVSQSSPQTQTRRPEQDGLLSSALTLTLSHEHFASSNFSTSLEADLDFDPETEEPLAPPTKALEWGRNPKLLDQAADECGLVSDLRLKLQNSRARERLEQTMAASPSSYGLRVWVSGEEAFLLDHKGFVCSTTDVIELVLCLRFESIHGSGSLRALLARTILDPTFAVTVVKSAFKLKPDPVKKSSPAPKAPKKNLSPEEFARLLEAL
jgi:hypothetical protein